MVLKYFDIGEFDSPDLIGSGENMNDNFLCLLDQAREVYGKPMIITSGFRTHSHNKKIGGVDNSSHLKGVAADIACTNSVDRWQLIEALREVGFRRIGIASTFIHVDDDGDKTQGVIWTY